MKKTKTDCRTEEGITVGLIDSLITISRVLRQRLKMHHNEYEKRYQKDVPNNYVWSEPILEALKDLHNDEDLLNILQTGHFNPNIHSEDDKRIMASIKKASELLRDKQIPIEL